MSGIMMSTFMGGAAAAVVQINSVTLHDISYGGTATAQSTFNSAGNWSFLANTNMPATFNWLLSGAAADYQISYTYTGSLSAYSTGFTPSTWVAMSTTRYVNLAVTGTAYATGTVLFSIRRASDSVVLVSNVSHILIAESKK